MTDKGPHLNALLPTESDTVILSYETYILLCLQDGADASCGGSSVNECCSDASLNAALSLCCSSVRIDAFDF